jgi:tetratricopeptide (TPR) repeat protein
LVFAFRNADELKLARDYCDQAIAIDPAYARAYAFKALSYAVGIYLIEPEDLPEGRTQGMACAETAVALDPTDGVCHWALGEAAFETKQYGLARDHMVRALALNPNDADVLAVSGYIHGATGDGEAGLRQMEMALERNPLSPSWYHWLRGIILFMLGRFDEALLAFGLYGSPNASIHRWRAVTLSQLGRIEEARAAVQALLAMRPDMSATEATKDLDYLPNLGQHIEALRQAGLPG